MQKDILADLCKNTYYQAYAKTHIAVFMQKDILELHCVVLLPRAKIVLPRAKRVLPKFEGGHPRELPRTFSKVSPDLPQTFPGVLPGF